MLRARYIEITRRRWYDVGFLVLISVLTGLIRLAGISAGNICYTPFVLITSLHTLYSLALTLSVYLLVNEFTHRHHQAFITAAILASMNALVFLHPQQESTLCSCALLLFSLYLLLKAMRRYGPQWHNMLGSAILLAASILEGGISPLYNVALPFLIIASIAIRPIIHYKKVSFPVCTLITIFLISVPAIIYPEPNFASALLRITDIHGFMIVPLSHYDRTMQVLFFLRESGLWIIIGLVSAIYALRSQRVHGDLSALIGVWWFILAIVLMMLHPTRHGTTSLFILIPFSFPIGAYFNLLSLPRRLHLRDRRIFRLLLITSALLFVCTSIYYSIFYPSTTPLLTVFLFLAFLFLIQIVFIVQHNYKGRKLPVHLTEISFIVFAILFAIGNIQFVFP